MVEFSDNQKKELLDFLTFYNEDFIKLLSDVRIDSNNKVRNQAYYNYYYNIIKKSGILFKELNLTYPVEISAIYEYLLWHGYFSQNKSLVYSVSHRKNEIGLVGADIMRGRSVCLNNADMLTHLLRECGIEAYTIGCTVPTEEKANFQYKPDIERNIVDASFGYKVFMKIAKMLHFNNFGNHAVTCFKNGDSFSVSDPTSLAFLNFFDMKKMKYVGSEMEITFKPWLMVVLNDIVNYEQFLEIIATISMYSESAPLKLDDIRNSFEIVLDICRSNEKLLDDFHSEIYDDIEGVCRTLK